MTDDDETPSSLITRSVVHLTAEQANGELRRIAAVRLPLTLDERVDELERECIRLRLDLDNVIHLLKTAT